MSLYNVESDPKLISLGDSEILLRSPFVREEVNALKEMVPNARWDRLADVWRIPVMDRELATQFAETWNYVVTEELTRMALPSNPSPPANVRVTPDKVIIRFPYDKLMISEVKKIPETRFHADTKTWRAPLKSLVEAVEFAQGFGLRVSEDAVDEAERVLKQREANRNASRASDGVIKVEGLGLDPYPYQRGGIVYASQKRRTFIADEMGLGKTMQALATIEHTNSFPCLVVVPPSLLLDWQYKIEEALPDRTVTLVKGRGDFPDHDTDFTVIGWSNIVHHTKTLVQRGYQGGIWDESQAYKNYKAQRTQAAIEISHSMLPDGVVLLLTGTPITGRPTEFEPQLDMMGRLKEFGGRWGFFMRYCGAYKKTVVDEFTGQKTESYHMDGTIPKGRLKELNDKLREICYVRRLKKDVLEDLPDMLENIIYVEMTPEWWKEYNAAEADIITYFGELKAAIALELGENATEAKIRAKIAARSAEHLVQLSVLKRITGQAKMTAVQEWMDARREEGNKVIIGAHHREITTTLAEANGGLKIIGGQSVESVEADKEKFQTLSCEEAPAIVLSIQAAKTGHTLHASSHALELELPWVPTDEDQFFGRAHRIGQTKDVQATRMLAAGTIDVATMHLLNVKRTIVNEGVDGIAPEETARNINMMVIEKYL